MQREQKPRLRAETGFLKGTSRGEGAVACASKQRSYPHSEKGRKSAEVRKTSYCYGEVSHMKASCRFRDAECRKCGKRGHIEAACRQNERASGNEEERAFPKIAAFGEAGGVRQGV